MRRAALLMVVAVVAAGCGDGDGDQATTTAKPLLSEGEAVWIRHGCGGCHTFARTRAVGRTGPNLDETLQGRDRDYIRRAIVDPAADAAPGWDCAGCGGMPVNFERRIPPDDLDALVDFLADGGR